MTDSISNGDNMIDSRDVIARIEELEENESRDEDETDELTALKALAEEAEGYASDWNCGATLIRGTYFQEYAQQLAEDIGAVNADATWPNCHIDWEAAADSLKMDYTSVDFAGVEYWVR